jgi:hypothetical protein
MGRRRRIGKHYPQKKKKFNIKFSLIPDLNKTITNVTKKISNAHKKILKKSWEKSLRNS